MELERISREFWRDGFIIIRSLFATDEIKEIEDRIDTYCRTVLPSLKVGDVFYEDGDSGAIKSMFRLQDHEPYFLDLAWDARLISIVKSIFSEGETVLKDVGFFGKAARDGSVTPEHQDNAFNFFEPPLCLKASLAIDDATAENGVMICQRGSHKLGVLPPRPSGILGFSQMLVESLDTAAYPEVPIAMKPGDMALHHTDTVHHSGPNTSDHFRRMLSMVYRSSKAKHNEQKLAMVNRAREEMYKSADTG